MAKPVYSLSVISELFNFSSKQHNNPAGSTGLYFFFDAGNEKNFISENNNEMVRNVIKRLN